MQNPDIIRQRAAEPSTAAPVGATLTREQLLAVGGGLNPQPLPPCVEREEFRF